MNSILSTDQIVIAFEQTGAGTPLLLVHGTNGNHTQWNMVLPFLIPHFTVYAMERRGRGQSGDAPEYCIQREFEDYAQRAAAQARSHSDLAQLGRPGRGGAYRST